MAGRNIHVSTYQRGCFFYSPELFCFKYGICPSNCRLISKERESSSYHNVKVMPTFVLFEFLGVAVLIRWQVLAPYCPFSSQVHRETWRMLNAFKGTFKFVVQQQYSNSGRVQIMELVHVRLCLSAWKCCFLVSGSVKHYIRWWWLIF